jgi:hypothetical protein
MLKNLIRDNQIGRTIGKWQKIMLNIRDADLIGLFTEGISVFPPRLDGNKFGLRVKSSDYF